MKNKIYVGCRHGKPWEIFHSPYMPTQKEYGSTYFAVIGPFRTKRGALYMCANPMCQSVQDAERAAAREAKIRTV